MERILRVLFLSVVCATTVAAQAPSSGPPIHLPQLKAAAQITRDTNGIAHIQAHNEHDLYFLQGWVHAQDRLFQMDANRRQASGTLAELLGPGALGSDVQLRTIGLRRAAQRSLAVLSHRARAALEAYAEGVNAFVAAHALPPEYGVLELTHFEPWTPLDSLVIAKLIAFGLSFDLDIDPTIQLLTYQKAGGALGFNGTALFFEDLMRSAPFDPASTVPDASVPASTAASGVQERGAGADSSSLHPATAELGKQYLDKIKDIRVFQRIVDRNRRGGSNEWAVSGALSTSGFPLVANDPHLALDVPSTFYPIHLKAGPINVIGSGFAGIPFVIVGHNQRISWGATTNPLDVTDTFQEQIAPDSGSPSGLSIVHQGHLEPILPIPEVFRKNNLNGVLDDVTVVPPGGAIPPFTLIVPRRNNGPIVQLDLANRIALSVQYTGFSATREVETFLIWNEATGLEDFLRGLQFFDFGSQNWVYSDVEGNIAYFTSGEMPIREDLQAGTVNGLPPFFIRNGTGGNEWLPVQHPQPGQAIPYEILPFEEMPHIINPPAGWFVNANNDPAGTTLDNNPLNQLRPGGGIYYLNPGYDGFRAGRITQMIRQRLSTGSGKISFDDMQEMQADTTLLDAEVFVPHILQAFARAQGQGAHPALAALAANPAIAQAVDRLRHWDFTTPTGIPEGYDASDLDGVRFPPSNAEIAASVAATLYSVWRGQFIRNTVDAPLVPFGLPTPGSQQALSALRHLLENFSTNNGVGASGVNFFQVPGVPSPADRRDILILKSLADALGRLSGPAFAAAFHNSTSQDDYRWGKLHRVVFDHLLGGPFSIPPAGGAFPAPLPGLPGIPTDGGFSTVDASSHSARADGVNSFMFGGGPANRFVSEAAKGRLHAVSSLPGGTSGVLGSPYYFNLLPSWLTNDAFPLLLRNGDVQKEAASVTKFVPAN
jgi:penicillin amidase